MKDTLWAPDEHYDFRYPSTYIVAAAVVFRGVTFAGMRHDICLKYASKYFGGVPVRSVKDGFIDNHGNFLDRCMSRIVAGQAGQIQRKTGAGNDLYSEDLW